MLSNAPDNEPKIGETWMVTKVCKEHRGFEHIGKPWTFQKSPAIRCRGCVWERVLESKVYGPETFATTPNAQGPEPIVDSPEEEQRRKKISKEQRREERKEARKKKREERFGPAMKNFPSKVSYCEHMIKFWQKKLEEAKKAPDPKDKKSKKFIKTLEDMLKDPNQATALKEIIAKAMAQEKKS